MNKIIQGNCLTILYTLDSESVDMCLTSPPYWGLRDYGVDGQFGLESTPEEYIEHMTQVFHEVKRVLKKEGTLWLNMGDTYGSGTGEGGSLLGGDKRDENKIWGNKPISGMQKCLCMIPERLAWSLIEDGWILRNKIIWYKPNGMPSSVKDRFSNKWEYLFMFSKGKQYYFDLDAVREPYTRLWDESLGGNLSSGTHKKCGEMVTQERDLPLPNPLGKNPGDVFIIPTQPFPEAHFAVFPEKLCEKPIKAGCPEQICKKCGKARERIIEKYDTGQTQKMPDYWDADLGSHGTIHRKGRSQGKAGLPVMANKTTGWTSCDCNVGFEGGVVLDPFCGAGTTCYVAKEMKRNYIGIDINAEYIKLNDVRLAQGVL